jgi:hypothetical protein
MDTLRVRDIRPLVTLGQEEACLLMLQRPLRLLWRWRSGGCLGPAAAAEMNQRQRRHRLTRPAASPVLDRGSTGGWHLDLVCPGCSRPCRVLFAHRWSQGLRPTCRLWACGRCFRVTSRSCNRPGSWKGRRPPSHAFRRHLEEAIRIRRDLMGLPPGEAEQLEVFPSDRWLSVKPRGVRMTWERWEALRTLAVCHEALAQEAHFSHCLLSAAVMGLRGPEERAFRLRAAYIRSLREQLVENRWATRQTNWHRQGKPRGGPPQRERLRTEDVLRRPWMSGLAPFAEDPDLSDHPQQPPSDA